MIKKLLISLFCGCLILGITGCSKKNKNEETKITQKQNEQEILSCLENELGGYIMTEKDTIKELPLEKITDKKEKISYYKGYMTNDNNMYIIYKGNITYEYEVMKDFDLYFSNKFLTYQKYILNNGIYILIHNNFNDIDFKKIENKCNSSNLEKENIKNISNKTIKKLNKTSKIVIKLGSSQLGTINNTETIKSILNIISTSEQYSYNNSDIAFLCDGHAFELEMYNDNKKLIDTVNVWYDGKRLMPKSLQSGCSYYTVANNDVDLREIIETTTKYKFYGLADYANVCDTALEEIYEDNSYKYYLNCIKSDKVLINFDLKNITMTLKYALNNNYITPEQLDTYSDLLIKEKK